MFTELLAATPQIVAPVANRIERSQLIGAVRTLCIQLRFRCTITLAAGPATAILNGGSILALFSRAGVDENGTRYIDGELRSLGVLSQMQSPRVIDLGRTVLSSTANGATALEESVFLYFSTPLGAGPAETMYLERQVRQALNVFVQQQTNGVGTLVQTPGTATISNMTVDVVQRFDVNRSERTLLLPVIRTLEFPVAGAATELPLKIDSSRYIRAILIQQDTSGAGEVTDIINSLALRADGKDIIGPSLIPYENLQAQAQTEFAGDVVSRGYLPLWFQKGGRLSNLLNPNTMVNLRFIVNCQPSVTVGAVSSLIRVTLVELEQVPGLTLPIPFEI
jgi:hypothetical protein